MGAPVFAGSAAMADFYIKASGGGNNNWFALKVTVFGGEFLINSISFSLACTSLGRSGDNSVSSSSASPSPPSAIIESELE